MEEWKLPIYKTFSTEIMSVLIPIYCPLAVVLLTFVYKKIEKSYLCCTVSVHIMDFCRINEGFPSEAVKRGVGVGREQGNIRCN